MPEVVERKRINITLIRPKSLTAPQEEQIIFRIAEGDYPYAFVLVRSRKQGESWWVQGVSIRQGAFYRARARFGNAATVSGSLFKLTLAFVKSVDELPEAGAVYKEIPEHFLLSQEFDIVLKK